ncbi:unnamed protein product [Clonostachys chloroleuca]|uniref:BHLH domain-containing protein n=1 Tax=Clonostachys chloroleuca TaxID=1926264 RepID=A0AA35PZY3_9HYPO|nr:unnamed protein product [Clonostachys chloroleuca]
MASPCFFRVESPYQPVADGFSDGGGWFLAGDDEIAVSPYDETFPKRELFEDVNLSNIPLSMLNGDANIDPAELSATDRFGGGFLGQDDESPVQPLFETQASTAAFMPKQEQFQPTPPGNTQAVPNPRELPRNQDGGAGKRPKDKLKMPKPDPSLVTDRLTPPATTTTTAAPGRKGQNSSHMRFSPRKRKSPGSATTPSSRSSTSPQPHPPPRKTTHNMIEKRYRTNLNDKIAALRDAVPSLRIMAHRVERDGGDMDEADAMAAAEAESMGGLPPAHKLNKATVLSKATEYIGHLERSNGVLVRENHHLRSRVAGLEMMLMMYRQEQQQQQQQQQRVDGGGNVYNGMWANNAPIPQ